MNNISKNYCNNCNSIINNILILKDINVCPLCYEILDISNKDYTKYNNLLDNILSNNIVKQLTSKLHKENNTWYYIISLILINLIIILIIINFFSLI